MHDVKITFWSNIPSLKIFFIILLISTILLFTEGTSVFASDSLVLKGNVDTNIVKIGQNSVITITLSNTGDLPIEELDVQLTAPGFKIINEKKWPVKIYPKSTINGLYLLEASSPGTHSISVSTTYYVNTTENLQPKIVQESKSITVDQVEVQTDWNPTFSSFWQGVASTSAGIIVGLVIPKIMQIINAKGAADRERRKGIGKVKTLLLHEFKKNEKSLAASQPVSLNNLEVRIDNEGLYYLIAEDANREDQVQELYVQLRSYNRLTDDQRRALDKADLLATIARVRQTIKDWQVV